MKPEVNRSSARERRRLHVRKKVFGTSERPRLNVFRSLNHIYAQIIDDTVSHTLAAASTVDKEVQLTDEMTKIEQAQVIGQLVAERALAKEIKQVVFDRAGYKFHGRVKALAEAAREAGLDF